MAPLLRIHDKFYVSIACIRKVHDLGNCIAIWLDGDDPAHPHEVKGEHVQRVRDLLPLLEARQVVTL